MDNEEKILYELVVDDPKTVNRSFYSFSKAALYQISLKLYAGVGDIKWKVDEWGDNIGYVDDYERLWMNECDFIEAADDITDELIIKILKEE